MSLRACLRCGYELTEYYAPHRRHCACCEIVVGNKKCVNCRDRLRAVGGRYCKECLRGFHKAYKDSGLKAAHSITQRAIRRGDLPKAITLRCVDCGKQATGYDHRDYRKPLDVEPVCRSCNRKRGHAVNLNELRNAYSPRQQAA